MIVNNFPCTTPLDRTSPSQFIVFNIKSFQDGTVNIDKMTPAQRHAYVDAHMTVQQHIAQANLNFQQQQQNAGSSRQIIKENDHQSHHQSSQGSSLASVSSHQQFSSNLKIPQISSSGSGSATASTYTTVPDDGLGYDNGIRVLQSIGSWTTEIPANIPRPNLIPFTEPYVEGNSIISFCVF